MDVQEPVITISSVITIVLGLSSLIVGCCSTLFLWLKGSNKDLSKRIDALEIQLRLEAKSSYDKITNSLENFKDISEDYRARMLQNMVTKEDLKGFKDDIFRLLNRK